MGRRVGEGNEWFHLYRRCPSRQSLRPVTGCCRCWSLFFSLSLDSVAGFSVSPTWPLACPTLVALGWHWHTRREPSTPEPPAQHPSSPTPHAPPRDAANAVECSLLNRGVSTEGSGGGRGGGRTPVDTGSWSASLPHRDGHSRGRRQSRRQRQRRAATSIYCQRIVARAPRPSTCRTTGLRCWCRSSPASLARRQHTTLSTTARLGWTAPLIRLERPRPRTPAGASDRGRHGCWVVSAALERCWEAVLPPVLLAVRLPTPPPHC